MNTIDVCLSPDLMHLYDVRGRTVVVVDIFRATSCMTTAFAHGVQSITPYSDLEACKAMSAKGFITSGERDGQKPPGFDKGNSPFEYMGEDIRGKRIAFTTTNGTQAIHKAAGAKRIVLGAFLNLTAVADDVAAAGNNVLVICSGWKGRVSLEDTLFAGALVTRLQDRFEIECDSPRAARDLYGLAKNDLRGYLADAAHVKRLARLNVVKDIDFCLTADTYTVVPHLADGVLVA
jgi:2-phosphosulfolactate phosphatase